VSRWLGCLYLFFLPWPRSCWWLLHQFLCTAFTQTWANGRSYPLFSQGQPQSWRPTYWQWYWCSWASPWYQGSSLSPRQCFRSHVLLKSYFLALDPPTTIDAQCSRLDSRLGAARQEDLPYRIDQAILTDASMDWSCWGLKAPRSSPSTEARLTRVAVPIVVLSTVQVIWYKVASFPSTALAGSWWARSVWRPNRTDKASKGQFSRSHPAEKNSIAP